MKIDDMIIAFLRLIIIPACVISLTACNPGPQEFGVLEGHVTIGPLEPAMREGEESPTPVPEVYASREIIVYKSDGKTEFTRVEIDPDGVYSAELPVGMYVIDINHVGIDSAPHFPKEIEIVSGEKTIVDIDIDTGIR